MAPSEPEFNADAWPLPGIEFGLVPATTALLIVDMQYHNADGDRGVGRALEVASPGYGKYFYERVRTTVIPNIKLLLESWRRAGHRVVFLTLGAELDDLSDAPRTARERSRNRVAATGVATMYSRSAMEFNILPELAPSSGELVVNKTTLGAFNSTVLDVTLRNLGVESLVMTGVVTNVCIETTARDAVDRGFNTVIVDDACAGWDLESHVATLRAFRRHFGRVMQTAAVIAETEDAHDG